ncbi:MAG: MotA/TolQ/ExbB proton channel family protein [Pseudomonadota bacterium]
MKQIKFSLKAIVAAASVFAVGAPAATAQTNSLSDVLRLIQEDARDINQENERRVAEFTNARAEQAETLGSLRAEVNAAEGRGRALAAQFDENEAILGDLQAQLQEEAGDFAELLGQFRTAAGEIDPLLRRSVISFQYPGRAEALAEVSQARTLPTRAQLDILWKAMLQEAVGQAEVTNFSAVVANENNNEPVDLLRIGPFTVFTAENSPSFVEINQGQLVPFAAQPAGPIMSGASSLVKAEPGRLVSAPIDPSQGDLLGLLADMPNLLDRVQQGGLPGYVVLFLLLVGLIIGIAKLIALFLTGNAVRRTAATRQAGNSNPLARIFQAYEDSKKDDVEALELRLDEAILKETPKLERGVNIVRVLAAIAPLLGLLGTVVGMIRTFTQITLVGTGDPKTMADGISQALVTTVEGLVAAVPLLLLHAFVSAQAKSVQQVLEEQAAGMVAERAEEDGARA